MAKPKSSKLPNFEKYIGWIFLIGGLVAMSASILLSVEVFERLKDPSFVPVCNLNPVLSCTSVADSSQSEAFGFPNYFIGIAGYAAIAAIGMAILAGAKFKRWFWQVVMIGLVFSTVFIHWLIYEALYSIGALCIFCMVVWAVNWPIFLYAKLYNHQIGNIQAPKRFSRAIEFAQRYHIEILATWFIVIIGLILNRFWYYWSTL